MTITCIYTIYLAICSLLAFFIYGIDKRKAVKDKWRISEKSLLLISLFGGAIGGYIGMKIFHHKTKHWYFHALHILAIALQAALWVFLYCRFGF